MFTSQKVSFKEAMKLIDISIAEAQKINKHIAISIAGPEGEIIAFVRMDEASPAASLIAQNKAYTSARDRKDTREMGKFMREKVREAAYWGDQGITGFGGGASIVQNDKVIGGIGISGLSEEEDERIAKVAIAGVYLI
jgi:glc operon protein GlcG